MNIANPLNIKIDPYTLNNVPPTPSKGVVIFPKIKVGRVGTSVIDTYGISSDFQKDIGRYRHCFHEMSWNNTSFSSLGIAGSSMTATGTVTGVSPSFSNFKNQIKRVLITGTATAASNAGIRYSSARYLNRTNGFSLSGRVGFPATMPSPYNFFCGVIGSTSQLGGSTDPSSQLDIAGIAKDVGDTNLQFIYNDGAGTATKIDTGIVADNTTMYIITVACLPNDTKLFIAIEDMQTGLVNEINTTTDISALTTLWSYQMNMGNGASGTVAPALNYGGYYGENL